MTPIFSDLKEWAFYCSLFLGSGIQAVLSEDALSELHMVLSKPIHAYALSLLPHTVGPRTRFKRKENRLYLLMGWVAKSYFKGALEDMLPPSSEIPYHSPPAGHNNSYPSHMQRTLTSHPRSLAHCTIGAKSRTSSSKSGSDQIWFFGCGSLGAASQGHLL